MLSVLVLLALLAAMGGLWLGWGQTSSATVGESSGGYGGESQPATLEEALAAARQALDEIKHNVRDYSAIIMKKQRIGNDLTETVMFAKIREEPFSVYLYFFKRRDDTSVKGREVIYVQGRNDDKLLVHTPGLIAGRLGTIALDPKGWIAMHGERHPITEIGLANLCRQLIQRGESAGDPRQVQVKRYRHARINTRACTLLEIIFPAHEPGHAGYLARVFIDNQWRFPIRVEIYDLPLDGSRGPQLEAAYTYLDLKLNNGYSDADFDPKNPQYKFP
jgi:hypothetical protein